MSGVSGGRLVLEDVKAIDFERFLTMLYAKFVPFLRLALPCLTFYQVLRRPQACHVRGMDLRSPPRTQVKLRSPSGHRSPRARIADHSRRQDRALATVRHSILAGARLYGDLYGGRLAV
jgi:hypothetical protein